MGTLIGHHRLLLVPDELTVATEKNLRSSPRMVSIFPVIVADFTRRR